MNQTHSLPAGERGCSAGMAQLFNKMSKKTLHQISTSLLEEAVDKKKEDMKECLFENMRLRTELERMRAELQFRKNSHFLYRSRSSLGVFSNLSSDSLSSARDSSGLSQLRYFMDSYQNKTVLGLRQIGLSGRFAFDDQQKERKHILDQIRQNRYSMARQNKLFAELETNQSNFKSIGPSDRPTPNLSVGSRSITMPNDRMNTSGLGEAILVDPSRASMYHLPRGAVYIQTTKGAVQFGIPPETIKDSLQMGLNVPTYYVVPKERFNLRVGINMCEVEFPAYFNFFLQNLSVNLIVMPEVEELIRKVVDETLEGPKRSHLYVDTEYPDDAPKSGRFAFAARPDHEKEINFFKEPRNGREINTDALVKFIHFLRKENFQSKLESGSDLGLDISDFEEKDKIGTCLVADLGNGILIEDIGNEYILYDELVEVARVPHFLSTWTPLVDPTYRTIVPATILDPPDFGITVLGSSHGFDESGNTSGFVLWMNKKGIMVDPPPNSTALLMKYGIIPSMIDAVILTHCHADHDAGTFQKILKEGKITLYTTKTIFDSFVRKYAIISGFTEGFLLKLFEHRLVKIGERVHWGGGTLRFFYSLHALPCIGFEAFFAGKSFVYSADTYYDPKGLKNLRERGYLSQGRYEGLMDFPFHYDLCIHEAGIPPIHTPLSALEQLPEVVKKNLYIIHITDQKAKETDLRIARAGVEHTITIETKPKPHNGSVSILRFLLNTDLFHGFSVTNAIDLLRLSEERHYKAGEYIYRKGDSSDCLYVIISGFCKRIVSETTPTATSGDFIKQLNSAWTSRVKILHSGDHFGDTSVLENTNRRASILALTTVKVLVLTRDEFVHFNDTAPSFTNRMIELSNLRRNLSWKAMDKNSIFSRLTSTQRSQLQAILKPCGFKAGKILWKRNKPVSKAYLIASGQLEFIEIRKQLNSPFVEGTFMCDLKSMLSQRNIVPLIEVMRDSVSTAPENRGESSEGVEMRSISKSRSSPRAGSTLGHSFHEMNLERLSGRFKMRRSVSKLMKPKKKVPILTSRVTLVAKTDCVLYCIEAEDILDYLDHNPGIFINLIDNIILE